MLMKIKDSHILYINLKEDTEKRKRIEHQLDSLKLSYTRVDAVRGSKLRNLAYRKKISKLLNVPMNKLSYKFWTDRKNFKTMCNSHSKILNKVGIRIEILKWTGSKPNSNIQKIARDNRYGLIFKKMSKINNN